MSYGDHHQPLEDSLASVGSTEPQQLVLGVGCGMAALFVADPEEYLRGVRMVLLVSSAIALPILWFCMR